MEYVKKESEMASYSDIFRINNSIIFLSQYPTGKKKFRILVMINIQRVNHLFQKEVLNKVFTFKDNIFINLTILYNT